MADACDQHYSYVAIHPKRPGAYASHSDDPRFADSLRQFKRKERWAGAKVIRVTCNEARRLMGEYIAWADEQERIKSERRARSHD